MLYASIQFYLFDVVAKNDIAKHKIDYTCGVTMTAKILSKVPCNEQQKREGNTKRNF